MILDAKKAHRRYPEADHLRLPWRFHSHGGTPLTMKIPATTIGRMTGGTGYSHLWVHLHMIYIYIYIFMKSPIVIDDLQLHDLGYVGPL